MLKVRIIAIASLLSFFAFILYVFNSLIRTDRSEEYSRTISDLIAIVEMLDYSYNTEVLEISTGENLNHDGFGKNLAEASGLEFGPEWTPDVLEISNEGNWLDPRGEMVQILFFGDQREFADAELSSMARRYRAVAWAVGKNRVNEYAAGDDVFLGLRRDEEWESGRHVSPWWKFWER